MKKITVKSLTVSVLAFAISVGTIEKANAYDAAKLDVEISNAAKSNYYVCISSVGCLRIDGKKEGIPIDPINVRYIFLANTSNYQIYPQSLPSSCQVTVNGKQTLIVKGNIAKAANDKVYIANLHCAVA